MATQLGRNFGKCLTARHFSAMGGTAMGPPPAHRFFSSDLLLGLWPLISSMLPISWGMTWICVWCRAATNSKKGRVRALVDFMELPYKLGLSGFSGAVCGALVAFIHLDGDEAF